MFAQRVFTLVTLAAITTVAWVLMGRYGLFFLLCAALASAVWECVVLLKKCRSRSVSLIFLYGIAVVGLGAGSFAWEAYSNTYHAVQLCVVAWSYDTCAYLIGSAFGRHRIFPLISPQKTWEGTLGGIVCAVGLCAYVIALPLLYILIVAVSACFGDFAESYVKRRAGMKDSGFLLPGHGGLLDRFDSVLMVFAVLSLVKLLVPVPFV